MEITQVALWEIEKLRDIYRHEMNCQVIHDSIHARPGWTVEYAITRAGAKIGYGSVAVAGPWKDKPTLYEFYVVPTARNVLFETFEKLLQATQPVMIETQSNDGLLAVMIQAYCEQVETESILFEDKITTHLPSNGASIRLKTNADLEAVGARKLDEGADWVMELHGAIIGTGGILYHYNRPYGDIFMAVAEHFRRRGFGAYLVQELKRICYEGGSIPGARCNPTNRASQRTLQKAGFVPIGHILHGTVRPI